MKLYKNTDTFKSALKSIVTRGKSLDRDIQRYAVSAILWTAMHGNCSHVNDLVANMPKGSRVNAVKDWFTTFGPVEYNRETKEFSVDTDHAAIMKAELASGAVLPELIAVSVTTPWTDFSPEAPYSPIDFLKVIQKAVASAQKRLDADEDKGDTIDPILLATISKLVTVE